MSVTLRVLLLVAALFTAGWILHKIRKLKVKIEDAIFWMISPANLIFLIIIFLLMEKVFTLSILVSQLEDKISVLSAEIALRSHATDESLKRCSEEKHDINEEEENETV